MKTLSELDIVFMNFCPFHVSAINAIAIVIMFAIANKKTGIENSIPTKTRTVNVSAFSVSPDSNNNPRKRERINCTQKTKRKPDMRKAMRV